MSRAIGLYRSILKEHKLRLPDMMRKLGDDYLRHEFKQHKNAKPEHLVQFYKAWDDYLVMLKNNDQRFGRDLDNSLKDALTPEQKEKLEDLKKEAVLNAKTE